VGRERCERRDAADRPRHGREQGHRGEARVAQAGDEQHREQDDVGRVRRAAALKTHKTDQGSDADELRDRGQHVAPGEEQ
jgi:hypothetical protein